ncbi:DoxX family protein [Frondihabitans australicus]|uniref:Putative oxidoreductase n=1 Tax=Frondihabitans australicus TaxID=386892 RepID=A0A495IFV8_9MICO|nr:DoxX family protein [Frondihabitans australicus]RKR74902.1 putative oxidoreductase [Frondihabitans australicus]
MKSTSISLGLVALRIGLGVIFAVHGAQKLADIAGTQSFFASIGLPLATLLGPAIGVLELVGGIAVVAGLATRVFAGLLGCTAVVAIITTHAANGFTVDAGGYEYVLVLALACAGLALTGPGSLALDHAVARRVRHDAA